MNSVNNLTVFNNNQFGEVRTVSIDGNPWFVAADVCRALDLSDTGKAVGRLDEDEPPESRKETGSDRSQRIRIIFSDPRQPQAGSQSVNRWITHDVIPSIRKSKKCPRRKCEVDYLCAEGGESIVNVS